MMKSSPTAFLVVLLIGFFITSALSAPIAGQQQVQQQESDATVGELIEDAMTTASEVGTASYALYKYIVSARICMHTLIKNRSIRTSLWST